MEGRDFGDNQVLQATTQETENGKVRFKTVLPSGRELVSEYMNPDDASGKIVIKWCDNVRAQIDVDNAEAEAVKKRESISLDQPSEKSSETVKASEEDEGEPDPVEFAIRQRDAYQERVGILETRITDMKIERRKMREHLESWTRVVDTLRGETDG